ncbi:hypothetical protein [Mycolicibacterium sp. 624]|uniref:hypothetical protein n=1 Tax=Mycolicibacterium sp. 624 TaxID=3156314 RepID=UPI003393805F
MLTVIDEFLRSDSIAALLAAHLRATGHDHPGYDAALLIDQGQLHRACAHADGQFEELSIGQIAE